MANDKVYTTTEELFLLRKKGVFLVPDVTHVEYDENGNRLYDTGCVIGRDT